MRKWIITVLAMIAVLAAAPASGLRDRDGDGVVLIIDLSRQLPQNPYFEEYEKMLYPTVRIKTLASTGSGVVIDNYIITAAHVVGDATDVRCEIWDGDGYAIHDASVVITDTIKDLALLSVLCDSVAKATLAPEDYRPYIFTPVYSVGCSLGYPPRPSNGIISVITDSYWEITAPILPGNSGGPVFDSRTYELIGIAVWVHTYKNQFITTMAGVVPINQIYEFLNSHRDTETTE